MKAMIYLVAYLNTSTEINGSAVCLDLLFEQTSGGQGVATLMIQRQMALGFFLELQGVAQVVQKLILERH